MVGPVPSPDVVPIDASHCDAAGALLAARHARHRDTEPLLAPMDADAARAAVVAALTEPEASGSVALRGDRVVGYLVGAPRPDPVWGRNVWVESAGLALADTEDAETVRDLYAAAAERWVHEGRTAHYALVPASDRAVVDAWFRLAFGHQHTHGIREVLPRADVTPARVGIRRAVRGDIPVLARLDLELPRHQALAPTFSAGTSTTYDEALRSWEEDFDDPDFATFVAVCPSHDRQVVGAAVGCALDKSASHRGPARPQRAGFLGFAAVLPEARGRGAGRALAEAVLAWSGEQGHSCVVTDWRATNLLSSRAWPALGFRPSFLRLHRLIGH
jgi:GNAT superfamily N-acetyltransferase